MGPLVVFAAALLEFHLLITVTVEAVETDIATGDPVGSIAMVGRPLGRAGRVSFPDVASVAALH